jgi:hypothetical protein
VDPEFEGTGELTIPELMAIEEPTEVNKPAVVTDLGPDHADLEEKPPPDPEETNPELKKAKAHPELKYRKPEEINPPTAFQKFMKKFPKVQRAKLDGWGMVAALAGLLAVLSSPLVLEVINEAPLGHLSDPGVDFHLSIVPNSSMPTGIFLNGFRIPYERDLVVHVPYNGAYRLEVKRDGYEKWEESFNLKPPARKVGKNGEPMKEEQESKPLAAHLVPAAPGIISVWSTTACAIEIGDGTSFWQLKTPVRELKLPPADYTVKFLDPTCNDKQFYVPIREGSRAYIVWEFAAPEAGRLPAGH